MREDGYAADADGARPDARAVAGVVGAAFVLLVWALVAFDVAVPNRSFGAFDALTVRSGTALALAGLLTQLGDPWFLLLVATAVYLAGTEHALVRDARSGAFVLAVTFGAFSLTNLLKHFFAAPRPPGAATVTVPTWVPPALGGVFSNLTTGTGYAFPSGHALGTAAVVAALASTLTVGSRPVRWSLAAVVVAAVAATRVVLGVHFLVDLAAGVVAGLSLFAVAAAVGRRRPMRAFGLSAGVGVLALVATATAPSGELWSAGQWLGASLGAGAAWHWLRPTSTLTVREAVVAGVPIAVLWVAIYATSPPLVVTVLGTAVAAATTVAAPTIAERARGI